MLFRSAFRSHFAQTVLALLAFPLVAGCSGGGGGGDGSSGAAGDNAGAGTASDANASGSPCDLPVIATWQVDGARYESEIGLSLQIGDNWMLSLGACEGDEDVQLTSLSTPVVLGAITLDQSTFAIPPPAGHAAGEYFDANSSAGNYSYETDDAHSGTFEVTNIDQANAKFSATFSFVAYSSKLNKTVTVTDGVITNVDLP
jgi:Family of unknown function (DUF6252)